METRWLYTNTKDFPALREASKKTCVIPVGAVEMHGYHLPLGTDITHVSVIAHMASQLETFTVAPDFWFGDVPGAQPEGGMHFEGDFCINVMETLCDQIGNQGFEKIILYNGHGGNGSWLQLFQRRLYNRKKPYAVLCYEGAYPTVYGPEDDFSIPKLLTNRGREAVPELTDSDCEYLLNWRKEKKRTGHACLSETPLMMAICPENVHLEYMEELSGESLGLTEYLKDVGFRLVDGGWQIDSPNYYTGDHHTECTETIGKASIRLAAEHLAKAVKLLKDDEKVMKWHNERIAKLD